MPPKISKNAKADDYTILRIPA
jgi:hypothetical protein